MAFDFTPSFLSNILNPDLSKKVQNTYQTTNQTTTTNSSVYSSQNTTTKNLSLILNSPYASSGQTATPTASLSPSISVIPSQSSGQSATPTMTTATGTANNSLFTILLIGGLGLGAVYLLTKKK
jgi:hypothetical protein